MAGEAEPRDEIRLQYEKPWEDRRQELVFIGINVDEAAVRADLNGCRMTEEELSGITPVSIEERCMDLPNPSAEHIEIPEEV